MSSVISTLCAILLLAAIDILAESSDAKYRDTASITIYNSVTTKVSKTLFGHFLERASFGEWGPEASLEPGTNHLQPKVTALLKQMNIPIIRFPAGTDVDYIDWRDMIDNVPGRKGQRPVTIGHTGKPITNRFGIDEYFALRDTLGCQTILVVNFLDALSRKVPLDSAAYAAAGLVAYVDRKSVV